MDLGLTGKIALVTGSSRGLGLATAAALVQEGCRVTICARGDARLQEAASSLRRTAGDDAHVLAVVADLATLEGIEQVVRETIDTFGALDILVNNVAKAGGAGIV